MNKNIQGLITRVVSDEQFRNELRANPAETLAREGIEANAELIDAIRGVNADDLTAMARDYENLPEHRKAAG